MLTTYGIPNLSPISATSSRQRLVPSLYSNTILDLFKPPTNCPDAHQITDQQRLYTPSIMVSRSHVFDALLRCIGSQRKWSDGLFDYADAPRLEILRYWLFVATCSDELWNTSLWAEFHSERARLRLLSATSWVGSARWCGCKLCELYLFLIHSWNITLTCRYRMRRIFIEVQSMQIGFFF